MLLPQQPVSGCSRGRGAFQHCHFLSGKRLVSVDNGLFDVLPPVQIPLRVSLIVGRPSDIVQLEQDTVLGVESLLMLCSQDDSPSAQATLKVRQQQTHNKKCRGCLYCSMTTVTFCFLAFIFLMNRLTFWIFLPF